MLESFEGTGLIILILLDIRIMLVIIRVALYFGLFVSGLDRRAVLRWDGCSARVIQPFAPCELPSSGGPQPSPLLLSFSYFVSGFLYTLL